MSKAKGTPPRPNPGTPHPNEMSVNNSDEGWSLVRGVVEEILPRLRAKIKPYIDTSDGFRLVIPTSSLGGDFVVHCSLVRASLSLLELSDGVAKSIRRDDAEPSAGLVSSRGDASINPTCLKDDFTRSTFTLLMHFYLQQCIDEFESVGNSAASFSALSLMLLVSETTERATGCSGLKVKTKPLVDRQAGEPSKRLTARYGQVSEAAAKVAKRFAVRDMYPKYEHFLREIGQAKKMYEILKSKRDWLDDLKGIFDDIDPDLLARLSSPDSYVSQSSHIALAAAARACGIRGDFKPRHLFGLLKNSKDQGQESFAAEESRELAAELGIAVRLLPRATPELNAMDHLWRHMKRQALANRRTSTIDESANAACKYILDLSRGERLQQAGVLSGNFWLTK